MMKKMKLLIGVIALFAMASAGTAVAEDKLSVLVYSHTAGFTHGAAIEAAEEVFEAMGEKEGWKMTLTKDPEAFTEENLAKYDVVVFNNTTQNVLPEDSQREAFKSHIRGGGGFVGIHAASDTLYDWEWYGKLIGAYFQRHPPGMQEATIKIEDTEHPTMQSLGDSFETLDEWYWFRSNPRENVHVLATLDRTSSERLVNYDKDNKDADHPIIWCHEYDGGRIWYTAQGHHADAVKDERFIKMVREAIIWTANK